MKQNGIKRRRTVELEVEDRPISSLSADELFAASLPRVPIPVQYEKMERFWERMGLAVVLDSTTYEYYLSRYTRKRPRRHL